ncbi:MAG TPA: hypothetical protein VN371_07730 [Chlorobaculum sp.]|nr:hypothetical protein [Chlorobaculum sp.]
MGEGQGNFMVAIALFGWIPLVMLLFRKLDPRLAVTVAFVGGWMFLPVAGFKVPGVPAYNKMTATCIVILFWAWKFDRERFGKFDFSLADLPMLLWCIAPFFSSVFNDLGVYDGLSQTMYQSITWGVPYFLARLYFGDAAGLKMLATAIFIGALIYIPFCWFELIMSPQLHRLTYGFHQHNFLQTLRDGGGFRPMVFMDHGLMTSMWMVLAVFLGTWMYYARELPEKILGVPSLYLLLVLILTTLAMKSVGAIVLLLIGLIVIFLSNRMKNVVLLLIMLLVPPLYVYTRSTGIWDGTNLSGYVAEKFSPTRAQSLQFRFDNETILINKALEGTFFGWGGFGRSRVFDEKGKDLSVTDGLWIITFGQNGKFGLIAMIIAIQTPVVLFLMRFKPDRWNEKNLAVPAVMAIFLAIYMIDNLLNAMINPIYMLFSGGLTGLAIGARQEETEESEEEANRIDTSGIPSTRFITDPCLASSRFIN